MIKKRLPNKFILVEGIDGGGKTTFTNYLEKEIKRKYKLSKNRSLSIFGQPSYRLEKNNCLFNMIEYGNLHGNIKKDITILKKNRIRNERDILKNFSGIKVCVRGVLTELGTIYAKYGILTNSNIGQEIEVDLLIIIDTPIISALNRIKERELIQWRERYVYLSKFKKLYSNIKYINKVLKPKRIIIIKNNRDINNLKNKVQMIVRSYI